MTAPDPALERARKRAKELRDFYGHLVVYVLICTMLVVLDVAESDPSIDNFLGLDWAYWPIFIWGAFVALHAANTFLAFGNWQERKVQQFYEEEKKRDLIHH